MRIKTSLKSFLFFVLCISLGLGAWPLEAAVGTTPGTFGVDHNGAAVYAVPLQVPPGTAGMQPHLSLVYQSDVPDGPVGAGWRLEGLERIDRCPPTIAQDGFRGPIDYSAKDRFCLDGERLVAISGTYGSPGTIYHTERESRVRVTSHGTCGNGPCWFELVRRDGTVLEMGFTADSRVLVQGRADVRVWAASAYRDTHGNTLRVDYEQSEGAFYPTAIRYTENVGLATGRRVEFHYADRFAGSIRSDQGADVRWGRALTEVRTFVESTWVRRYILDYDQLAGLRKPRLVGLTECDGAGDCLPPTSFEWAAQPVVIEGYGFNSIGGFDFGYEDNIRMFADVNGDGRADYCRAVGNAPNVFLSCAFAENDRFGNHNLNSDPNRPFDFGRSDLPRGFFDVDGDGRADYCRAVQESAGLVLSCALANDAGFVDGAFRSNPGFDFGYGHPYPRAFVDADGDGRMDYCRAVGSPIYLSCALAKDGGTFGSYDLSSLPGVAFDFGYAGGFPRIFADANGDGRADYCRAVGGHQNPFLSCALSWPGGYDFYGFNSVPHFDWGLADKPRQFADVNGDGRIDYCRGVGGSPSFLSCALARGTGFGNHDFISEPEIPFDFGYSDRPRGLVDMDGDGRADYCRFVGSPAVWLSCAVAGERGFGRYDLRSDVTQTLDTGYPSPLPRAFVPVAPGGGASYCRAVGIWPSWVLSCTRPQIYRNRVERIVDGFGATLDITYSTLDDPGVYTPASGVVYPTRDVRGGRQDVVASYTRSSSSDGLGSFEYTYGYHYAGARWSADGRGWQGFREVVRRDTDLGLVTRTELLQSFPFTGRTASSSVSCDPLYGRDPKCTELSLLHRSTLTYEATTPFPPTREVLLREVLAEALEYGQLGTSTRTVHHHDAFGNVVLEEKTSSTPRITSQVFTRREFLNDPVANRFGLPTLHLESRDFAGTEVLSNTRWLYEPGTFDVVEVARWDSTADRYLTVQAEYDRYGNPVRITKPGGHLREMTYDPAFQTFRASMSTRGSVDGPFLTTLWQHDPRFGRETSRIDPNGGFRTTTYDGFGRVARVEGPHPETAVPVVLRHQAWRLVGGVPTREVRVPLDWSGLHWATRRDTLDSLGRTVRSTRLDPDGATRTRDFTYASTGRLTTRSKPYASGQSPVFETFAYDSMGRLARSENADGLVTLNTYWAPTHAISVVGEGTEHRTEQHLEYLNVNGRNKIRSLTHGNGQKVEFRYDPLGRVEQVLSSDRGELMQVAYDSLGRRTRIVTPETGVEERLYDAAGHLQSRIFNGQSTRSFAYDTLGRLVREIAQANGQSETIDYHWDDPARGALGRLASVSSSASFGYDYTYDAHGRVRRQDVRVGGRSWALERSFDPSGRAVRDGFPDGSVAVRSYNGFGNLEAIDFSDVGAMSRRLVGAADYLPIARPEQVDLGPVSLALGYTSEGSLVERRVNSPVEGLADWQSVGRTAGFWVDGVDDHLVAQDTQTFTYDGVEQLQSAHGGYPAESFAYSSGGDMLSRNDVTFEYSNGLLTAGRQGSEVAFQATYDHGGRTLTRTTEQMADELFYGPRDRLQRVDRDGVVVASFLYDHRGRRIYKNEAGVETFYPTRDFEETVHAGGAQQTRYLRAPRGGYVTVSRGAAVDRPGYPADGDQYFVTDHLGSVRQVFDGEGRRTARVDYTPFGEIWRLTGEGRFRHAFAGMELDRSTGFAYDRARYYDPSLGRFLTPDSRLGGAAQQFAAFNRYAYVANNPLLFVDPSGHNIFSAIGDWIEKHIAVVGILIGAAEFSLGVTVNVLSGGALAPLVGDTLIGAGLGGIIYSAVHFNDFSWKGWGISEGIGAGAGFLLGVGRVARAGEIGLGVGRGALAGNVADVGLGENAVVSESRSELSSVENSVSHASRVQTGSNVSQVEPNALDHVQTVSREASASGPTTDRSNISLTDFTSLDDAAFRERSFDSYNPMAGFEDSAESPLREFTSPDDSLSLDLR